MLGIYLFIWNRYVLMVNTLRSEQNHFVGNSFPSVFSMKNKNCYSHWNYFFRIDEFESVFKGKGGGLAPNRQQVIALTNGDPAHERTYVTSPQWVNPGCSIESELCVYCINPLIPLYMSVIVHVGLPWIIREPHWLSMRLPETSEVAWQVSIIHVLHWNWKNWMHVWPKLPKLCKWEADNFYCLAY